MDCRKASFPNGLDTNASAAHSSTRVAERAMCHPGSSRYRQMLQLWPLTKLDVASSTAQLKALCRSCLRLTDRNYPAAASGSTASLQLLQPRKLGLSARAKCEASRLVPSGMELVSEFIAPRRKYVELLSTPLMQIEAQQEEARGNEKDSQDIQEYGDHVLAICTVIEAKTVMYLLPRRSPSQSGHHLRSDLRVGR